MMTTTATRKDVLKAARARWPDAKLSEFKGALKRAEREANIERRNVLYTRRRAIDAELGDGRAIEAAEKELRSAARFVVDVNGGHPSIEQLKAALEPVEHNRALMEERQAIKAETQTMDCYSHRWRVGQITAFGAFHIRAEGDTLDDLMAKIQAAK